MEIAIFVVIVAIILFFVVTDICSSPIQYAVNTPQKFSSKSTVDDKPKEPKIPIGTLQIVCAGKKPLEDEGMFFLEKYRYAAGSYEHPYWSMCINECGYLQVSGTEQECEKAAQEILKHRAGVEKLQRENEEFKAKHPPRTIPPFKFGEDGWSKPDKYLSDLS